MPDSKEICLSASMIAAQSTDFGHLVVHVWQETHSQMARLRIAASVRPSWTRRTIWLGTVSMRSATGQPAVHLPH